MAPRLEKTIPAVFNALHIKKKKSGIETKQLQILVTFQTLQFNSKFPLLILEFLSKIHVEAEGYHSTSSHRATRTIITIS